MKLTITAAVALETVLRNILIETKEDGTFIDRDLPFGLRLKLQKARDAVLKDVIFFEDRRAELIKQYGEEDGEMVKVKEENVEVYKEQLMEVLKKEVEHTLPKLKLAELEDIKEPHLSTKDMDLFIATMTDPEEFDAKISLEDK